MKIEKILPASILLLHTVLILFKGYFLSIEFTLYPYLTAHGFLPYREIIDHHFPTLLFGPFALPAFLTGNPWLLLPVFLLVLLLTDVILYSILIRYKVKSPLVWLLLYVVSSVYFAGNVLWIETFINLLLVSWIFLSFSRTKINFLVSGFLFSQILLLRPTITPAVFLFVYGLSLPFTRELIMGAIVGFLIPGLYLVRFGLLVDFYRLAFEFNSRVYPRLSMLLPAKRQILLLLLWLAPISFSLVKNKKFILLAALLSLLVHIFPRFGFEHLQPLFLMGIIIWAKNPPKTPTVIYLMIFSLLILNMVSTMRHRYGNYFLSPEVVNISRTAKELPGYSLYLLGASDLIYPLSGKLPPNYTYLPSLPWYFNEPDLVNKVIDSLKNNDTPVIVDYAASVDGYNVVVDGNPIYEYIKMNFIPGEKIGHYQIFLPKP